MPEETPSNFIPQVMTADGRLVTRVTERERTLTGTYLCVVCAHFHVLTEERLAAVPATGDPERQHFTCLPSGALLYVGRCGDPKCGCDEVTFRGVGVGVATHVRLLDGTHRTACKALREDGPCDCATSAPLPQEKIKLDDGKIDWSLLPFDALEETVKVLQWAASSKYARDSWRYLKDDPKKGPVDIRAVKSALRHIISDLCMNERVDPESELLHLAHASCQILFALAHRKGALKIFKNREDEP